VASGVSSAIFLRPPVAALSNGLNLAESAYDYAAEEPGFLYASVTAIAQFAFRADCAIPLKDPESYGYRVDPGEAAVEVADVLVTRSNAIAPGVAWPGAEVVADGVPKIIPSGFVIRARVNPEVLEPFFLAAILNHPVWRMWSAALAAGKSQLNLSQAQLAEIAIPNLPIPQQAAIGDSYRQVLTEIGTRLRAAEGFSARCDRLLSDACGLRVPPLTYARLTVDKFRLSEVLASSAALRIDPRFHRGEVRRILEILTVEPFVPLQQLMSSDLIKGKQPTILNEDETTAFAGPRVVSTGSIQAGVVVPELTKLTTPDHYDRAGVRQILEGDILVTMDGEGSIGKAAVFVGDYDAIPDSHVAIVRLSDSSLAPAVVCAVNCSLGQAQVDLLTTGATGQTQISKGDLLGLRVPMRVLASATAVSDAYQALTQSFEELGDTVKKLICEHSLHLTRQVCEAAVLTEDAATSLRSLGTTDALLGCLNYIRDVAT
jgi:hypothetical protein